MPAPARCDPYFRAALAELPAPTDGCVALIGQAALRVMNNKSVATPRQEFRDNAIRQVSNAVTGHAVRPFVRDIPTKGSEMSSVSIRNFLPCGSVRPAKVRNTAERVQFALQAWGKQRPAPIKQIQHIADVDQKTASAWYHGKQPPRADHLFTLALHIPELKAEIARLLELEQDGAEGFQREAIALLQRWAR